MYKIVILQVAKTSPTKPHARNAAGLSTALTKLPISATGNVSEPAAAKTKEILSAKPDSFPKGIFCYSNDILCIMLRFLFYRGELECYCC